MKHGQTAIVYFVSKSIATGVSFIATVYFARLLGAEVLGMYALALAVVAWLEIGGKLGLEKAIVKRLSEGTEKGAHFAAGAMMMGGLFTVMALLVLAGRTHLEAYIGAPVAHIMVGIIAASLIYRLSIAALQGHHLVHVYALLSPSRLVVGSIIQVGLVLIGLELAGLLTGYALGMLLAATAGFVIVAPAIRRPEKKHITSVVSYAKYAWLGSISDESFRWVDITVLGLFVSQGLVGIYMIAMSVAAFLNRFGSAISTTLFPEISFNAAAGNDRAVNRLVEDSFTYAGLFLIPGVVGGALLADRILLIYGSEFVAGTIILWILVGGFLVYSYQKQFVNALNAVDRPELAFRVNGVFIVANVVLNVTLISTVGWVGAAIATALAATIGAAYGFVTVRRTLGVGLPIGEIGSQFIAATVMGVFVYGGRRMGGPTELAEYNVLFVCFLVGLGGGIYFVTLFLISERFRQTVVSNLPPLPVGIGE